MSKGFLMAVDVGFGTTKLIGDSRTHPEGRMMSFPSFIGPYSPIRFATGLENDHLLSRLILEYQQKKYFVGSAAVKQKVAQATIETDRAVSVEGMVLLMTALSLLAEYDQQAVNLVIGLPISDFNDTSKAQYKQAVLGTHNLRRLKRDGTVEFQTLLHINDARVLPQPFGAMFNYLLDDAGNLISDTKAAAKIGIIDIGYNTMDLAWADNLELINNRSESYPRMGLYQVVVALAKLISEAFGVSFTPEEASQVLNQSFLTIKGQPVDLFPFREDAATMVTQKIISQIKNKWPDMWQLDIIILCGGGAYFLQKEIRRQLNMDDQIIISPNPWWNNVLGYYKYGKRVRAWK